MMSRANAFDFMTIKGRVLDLGCYNGVYVACGTQFVEPRPEVIGIDRDLEALHVAKHLLHDVVHGDVRHLPFRHKTFDLALALEILEHLPRHETSKVMSELRYVSDGLLLTTPNEGPAGVGWSISEHPLMRHEATISVSDLKGYGATRIRGIDAKHQLRVHLPFALPRFLLAIAAYYFPARLATTLLAYYDFRSWKK